MSNPNSTDKPETQPALAASACSASLLNALTSATIDHVRLTMSCIECAPEIRKGVEGLIRESFQRGFEAGILVANLDSAALARTKPALMRKIRDILKTPNGQAQRPPP